MKRILYSAIALAMSVSAVNADELKMDASSRQIAESYRLMVKNPGSFVVAPMDMPFEMNTLTRSTPQSGCIITLSDGYTAEDVEAYGLEVTSGTDDIITAYGNVDAIIALAESDVVKQVDFAKPLSVMTDKSREVTRITDVHSGTGLPSAFDGTGVVCGIYDTGIDPNHVNFYDKAFSKSRVKAVWRATSSGGSGTLYSTADEIAKFTTDSKTETHGTHTLGCMTGAYSLAGNSNGTVKPKGWCSTFNSTQTGTQSLSSRKNIYYGTAPGADIYVGCGQLYDANILAAVGKICDYAEANNQPAVVNLSIGHVRGSHDGTDATSRRLAELGKRAIIFLAAGNDGDSDLSIVKKLTSSDNQVKTLLNADRNYQMTIEFWSDTNKDFTVIPIIFDKSTKEIKWQYNYTGTDMYTIAASNMTNAAYKHDAKFDAAFAGGSAIQLTGSKNAGTSNRYSVSATVICNYASTNTGRNQVMGFMVQGTDGQRIDIVKSTGSYTVPFSSNGMAGWSDGTADLSISGMACGDNIIVVGAYTARNNWPSKQGVITYTDTIGMEKNEAAGFSSYGVLANGRSLPDICAPGVAIISSLNSYSTEASVDFPSACYTWNGRDYYYGAEQGTSMATPLVAGIVATWLQADPSLTVDDVRNILKASAIKDSFVNNGKYPDAKWGAGKVDAYEGLRKVLNLGAVNDIKADEQNILIANKGGNTYEVFVSGASNVTATVYNMSGAVVSQTSASGDTATFDGSNLAKGIYIINVNGLQSSRVVIK